MGNEFVDYLNSMNNATSGNENALAESQVLNRYYDKIMVEREVGNKIYNRLFSEKPRCVILTGHAGDGKTSVLVQILSKLGYFSEGKKPLKKVEVFNSVHKLFYVKDMSELNELEQENNLINFLQSPHKGISSILVSNTGPLINTFKRLISKKNYSEEEFIVKIKKEEFESEFLDSIDRIQCYDKKIPHLGIDVEVDIINIANIDNTYLVSELIDKLCNKDLWNKCNLCDDLVKAKCPIFNNINMIVRQKQRVQDITEKIYFWLNESESRLTIRQMISHISYSITGNLTCQNIKGKIVREENPLFDYSYPNLFFGYIGTEFKNESLNIKTIRELHKLQLDNKSLLIPDNTMFVKEEFLDFHEDIKEILEKELESKFFDLGLENGESQEMRRAFRRFYILLCRRNDYYEDMLKTIFSEVYPLYFKLSTNKNITWSENNNLKDILFEGLYKVFIGVHPLKNENNIYLTLKKNFEEMQNVQIVLGYFSKDDINIILKNNELIEKSLKISNIYIKVKEIEYEITHEFLNYLYSVKEGTIFTSYNPNFTFGISKFKSDLIKRCKVNENDIRLLIIKKDNIDIVKMYLSDKKLNVRR